MNLSIGDRWEGFVDRVVEAGRYNSASEVVREGLRLVEGREAKVEALRQLIAEGLDEGGEISAEALHAAFDAEEAALPDSEP